MRHAVLAKLMKQAMTEPSGSRRTAFKTGALSHSATHPCFVYNLLAQDHLRTNLELAPIWHRSPQDAPSAALMAVAALRSSFQRARQQQVLVRPGFLMLSYRSMAEPQLQIRDQLVGGQMPERGASCRTDRLCSCPMREEIALRAGATVDVGEQQCVLGQAAGPSFIRNSS